MQLFLGRIHKKNAHADSLVHVENLAVRQEIFIIAGDDDRKRAINGKGAWGIYVASLAANLGHSSYDAHVACRFRKFRDGQDGITRYRAFTGIRPAQTRRTARKLFQSFSSRVPLY